MFLITNTNMEITNSNKTYKAPQAKVVKVNVQNMLCQSVQTGFTLSNATVERGDDSDWDN